MRILYILSCLKMNEVDTTLLSSSYAKILIIQ